MLNKFQIFLLLILIISSYSQNYITLELNDFKRGTLRTNEYEYYILTLPNEYNKTTHLVIELKPNENLDILNNIVSDPNLYISNTLKTPNINQNTWKCERFGDETILIDSSHLSPLQNFYISVHCKEKCNYIIKAQLVEDIIIKEKEINRFNLNPNTVTKYSFTTREIFNELYIYAIGSYINSFNAYLSQENPSSSNTLPAEPIIFNGYKFTINKSNANIKYNLIIDNNDDSQDLTIWMKYDHENILIKEADILYDSIPENKAHCYYYIIDYFNKDKELVLSTNLFNGIGFLHIAGFNPIDSNSIKATDKNIDKGNNYNIIQTKAIKFTKDNFKNLGTFKNAQQNFFNFCFFAEKNTSLSLKVYFFENYKRLQALNIIYPGLENEDIIPQNSLKKYSLQHFNFEKDIMLFALEKSGKIKLYLYMAEPEEENMIIDKGNFDKFKKSNQVIEALNSNKAHYLFLTKESNRCVQNPTTGMYYCYLDAVVECESNEDCAYTIFFDHSYSEINLEPKKIISNVVSEKENDYYRIIISDKTIKNLVIVLMQNTGKTLLRLQSFTSENSGYLELNEEAQNSQFLPNLIKISAEKLNIDNLKGVFIFTVKGLSYATYSLYYYCFKDEEDEDILDQDKIVMKLEKGRIIRDIFMEGHRFKVYVYDSSIIGKKSSLYIGLVETDYTNLELYVFKDLNDFSIYKDIVSGYLWKGDYKDYIYIGKDDEKYLKNDILYILIYKKMSYAGDKKKDKYTSFYLGITDETTPLELNEGIEFKYQLNSEHKLQKFYYYFIDVEKGQDLQISFSLFYGHVNALIIIDNNKYNMNYIVDESSLITIKKDDISKYCKKNRNCGIEIEVKNEDSFLQYSSFLISVKSSKNTPTFIKPGIISKKTILTGEDQHYIVEVEPEESFGTRITVMFINGEGEIYVRRVLRNDMFEINNFPDENNYEYMTSYKESKNEFLFIDIPYNDFSGHSHCQLLITLRGIFPGYFYTKITYSIYISSSMFNIDTDKNYRLFVSQGEVVNFHFKVGLNKKRLYISMSNKEKDANMYLTNDKSHNNIYQYEWKSSGAYNEFLDLSINDPYFTERGISYLDGDYYLAIQGLEDTFYNLYISSQDVKIITVIEGLPGSCTCESENDNCYFRYENINNIFMKDLDEKRVIFYTEFTYGSGVMHAKLYKNGDLNEILNSLPSTTNNDISKNNAYEFLFMNVNNKDDRFTRNSVIIVAVQCKEKSLFDLSAVLLDSDMDVSRNSNNIVFLRYNQDNVFYLSPDTGISTKFIYYIYENENLNFQIKSLYGKTKIHTYTNSTLINYNFLDEPDNNANTYHHICDFELEKNDKEKEKGIYYGKVSKNYGYKNYFYIEVKPLDFCLLNINVNFDNEIVRVPLNKEIIGIINDNSEFDAYYDFTHDIDEVIITVTSLEKNIQYDVFLKTNIINTNEKEDNIETNKYSKASNQNYDIKGKTNDLTMAISLRIKNAPKTMRTENHIVRILININAFSYAYAKKVKILVTPLINKVARIKPEQNVYYFSDIEEKYKEKTVFNLKNTNDENDLMIIEISSCKGGFLYSLTDTPPLDTETYYKLLKRKIPSKKYQFNGKTIITLSNIELKEYYLTLFGSDNKMEKELNLYFREKGEKEEELTSNNNVDVLFYYYTTNKKNYNYLITNDSLIYETKDNFYSIKLFIPESKNRDVFGKEKNVDFMNYTLIISDDKKDFVYMESTCYLTKLKQKNQNNKFNYLKIDYDKKINGFLIKGLYAGKVYYMNVLAQNEQTGEVITYKPVMIVSSLASRKVKLFVVIFLSIVAVVFLYATFTIYRKYRLQKLQFNFVEENIEDKNIEKKMSDLHNINLDFVKKNDNNSINED